MVYSLLPPLTPEVTGVGCGTVLILEGLPLYGCLLVAGAYGLTLLKD